MADTAIERFRVLHEVAPGHYKVVADVIGSLADAAEHIKSMTIPGRLVIEPILIPQATVIDDEVPQSGNPSSTVPQL